MTNLPPISSISAFFGYSLLAGVGVTEITSFESLEEFFRLIWEICVNQMHSGIEIQQRYDSQDESCDFGKLSSTPLRDARMGIDGLIGWRTLLAMEEHSDSWSSFGSIPDNGRLLA